MENDSLLRSTLLTVAAMVGACALFIGTMSVVAVLVTNRAVNAQPDMAKDAISAPTKPAPTAKS